MEAPGRALAFDPACLTLATNEYSVGGFRQSFKYFNRGPTESALRQTLRFRNATLVTFARSWLAALNGTATRGDTLSFKRYGGHRVVGIHVRHGMTGNKAFGGCIPSAEFYLSAMEHYRYCNTPFLCVLLKF